VSPLFLKNSDIILSSLAFSIKIIRIFNILVEFSTLLPYTNKKNSEVVVLENKKSYTEMMKASAMTRKRNAEKNVMEIYIDMLLNEIILTSQKAKLLEDIDAALDHGDESLFLKLTEELKEINIRYGS
jgi:IDEAL domain